MSLVEGAADPGSIPTVLRLLRVVEELTRIGRPATPTEINETLGLPKSTAHRLCETLEAEGFLLRDLDGRRYGPGARLRALAEGVLSSQRVRAARLAILRALSAEIGETCNINIPDGDVMLYLDRVEAEWPLRIQLRPGSQVPLYCTATGKMYLSTLDEAARAHYLANAALERRAMNTITDPARLMAELAAIRAQGYAVDNEEFIDSMVAIAVPVTDRDGRFFAALAAHGPVMRIDAAKARGFLPRLRAAAAELAALAGSGV